jgi:3-oxoacyl-[acyl-carrier protein] reductase
MSVGDLRVCLVTGASRGLGREIALRFGAAGCRVIVNCRERADAAQAVADEVLRLGGEAVAIRADIRISGNVDAMMSEALQRWGSIDVLVNNAGITRDGLAARLNEEDWDAVIDTNLRGPFLCMRAAARIMTEQRSGHIISLSSIAGIRGREGQANYAASKAGLIGLTRAAAKELGGSNIQVNCVLPGYLPTDMGTAAPKTVHEQVLAESALRRTSTTAEVALFIYHLSLMQNVSGQVFNLDSRVL